MDYILEIKIAILRRGKSLHFQLKFDAHEQALAPIELTAKNFSGKKQSIRLWNHFRPFDWVANNMRRILDWHETWQHVKKKRSRRNHATGICFVFNRRPEYQSMYAHSLGANFDAHVVASQQARELRFVCWSSRWIKCYKAHEIKSVDRCSSERSSGNRMLRNGITVAWRIMRNLSTWRFMRVVIGGTFQRALPYVGNPVELRRNVCRRYILFVSVGHYRSIKTVTFRCEILEPFRRVHSKRNKFKSDFFFWFQVAQ